MDTVTGGRVGSALFVYFIREWLLRYDSPRNLTILPWCTMRSNDRRGHVAVSEHLAPPSELQVRGEHHAPLLVGIRDDLEQEPGPVDVDRQVAQLVDDQQPGAAYRAQFRVEAGSRPSPAANASPATTR